MIVRVTTLSLIAAGSCSTPLSVWTIERIGPELVGACGLWSCHQALLWRLETHHLTHRCSTQLHCKPGHACKLIQQRVSSLFCFEACHGCGYSGAGPSLSSSPKGAYTITRSNSDGSTILLWRQHMERLAQSMLLLAEAMPSKSPDPLPLSPHLKHLIFPSLQILGAGLCRALELRKPAEEICISIFAYRNEEFESHSKKRLGCEWEIGVHLSRYLPRPFSTAVDTAIMGPS
ncbi:unnamed protein product [Sphagnum troendelagicum]|uniref:Uncharacterized protein n=1 Tax=Sphagnum troendelagicum TaxID=128251 RepID=A0ABP0U6H3_9BRYO